MTLIAVGITMLFADIVYGVGRRQPPFGLKAIFVQRIGIGLLFLGLGFSMIFRTLDRGLDLGGLLLGAVIAGFGGLYFISVTDPVFKKGKSVMDLSSTLPAPKRRIPKDKEESMDSKASRLHELVHPEDGSAAKRE